MFKVDRSFPAPKSLALKASYSKDDVMVALAQDFHNKCYICETRYLISLQIEHFVAHEGNIDLKYDWCNLFFACARCNNLKGHRFNNLLNCTDPEINILRRIKMVPNTSPGSKMTIIAVSNDDQTIETVKLLNKVFNEEDTANKRLAAVTLRKRVWTAYAKLVHHMNTFTDSDSIESERSDALQRIRHLMNISQEYSAFLRWAVLEDREFFDLVKDIVE